MHWETCFPKNILMTSYLMTLLMVTSKGTVCHKDREEIECFSCSSTSFTGDHYCGDPFNSSHPDITKVMCKNYCVKWVVELTADVEYLTRTCSSSMDIKMTTHLVCMTEGGSRSGQLCFCNQHECNGSDRPRPATDITTVLVWTFVSFLLELLPS